MTIPSFLLNQHVILMSTTIGKIKMQHNDTAGVDLQLRAILFRSAVEFHLSELNFTYPN